MSMEKDIQRQLAAGEGDPEYWEVRRLVKHNLVKHNMHTCYAVKRTCYRSQT
jgi:hypothetical protein